jgi:hypothetical protein
MEAFMNNETKASGQLPGSEDKQAYQKPVLTVLDDLRTITLAPSNVLTEESYQGGIRNGRDTFPVGIENQFERGTSRRADSSGNSGRSGRN